MKPRHHLRKKKIYLDFNLSMPLEIYVLTLLFGTNFSEKLPMYREGHLRASCKSFGQSSGKDTSSSSQLFSCVLDLQHIQKACRSTNQKQNISISQQMLEMVRVMHTFLAPP
jgi:hypothetical protein